MTRAIPVGLGDRAYEVVVGEGLIEQAGARLTPLLKRGRTAVVADETVARLHGDRLVASLSGAGVEAQLITVPPGEGSKSFDGLAGLCDRLLALELDRGDVITAFGGGVVGDLTGFAAAIYKRGVDFVQIPTTLLAQVDSSVGGKTAIDTPRGKNLIGAFHQPRLVLADLDVLATLPEREMRCGYAEVIKYGLLGDFAFFEWLEAHGAAVLAREPAALAHAVERSVAMKAEIVAEDEREASRRALLNLGHTFGHALEAEVGFGDELLHGEAVGLGMAMAFRFSAAQALCPGQDAARAEHAIAAAGLPVRMSQARPAPFSAAALVRHMTQDKKAEDGRITLILAHGLGRAFTAKTVDAGVLRDFLIQEGRNAMTMALLAIAPVILVLLAVSGVFSAAETALTGISRGRMHQLEKDGDAAAARVNRLTAERERMIGSVLLGNNLINILSSALITEVLSKTIPGGLGVIAATGLTTVLVLVFAEVLPKTLAIARSDDVARFLSAPTEVAVWLFGPPVAAVQWLVGGTLNVLRVDLDPHHGSAAAHEEIRGAVEYHHHGGLVESGDRRMLGGVLDLADLDVSEVMVHRKSISMLDADLPPRELVRQALEAPYSRLPLYRGDADNIVGVVHAKDLLSALASSEGGIDALDIAAVASEPWFIPDTTNLKDQLNAFLKRRSHFALVVDEYGALQGLVTLEDILEEIVGEIEDEHDLVAHGVRRQPDGSVTVEGSVSIRELNRAMDWDLPDEDAVTVAGLVIHEAQTIPDAGQTFIFHGHRFQILRRQRNQITAIKVGPPEEDEDENEN